MTIMLGLAGETVTFTGPPAPNPPDSIGYNTTFQLQLVNNTGTTLNGVVLDLQMVDPHLPFQLLPAKVEFGFTSDYTANYAFFTQIAGNSFAGHTITLLSPDGKVTTDGVGPAASKMEITGAIAPGATISGDFTIHNTELVSPRSNDFSLKISDAPTNFLVSDVTTGANSTASGNPYSGPVAGLQNELIMLTPDKINVMATTPNVFIHSGSGDDSLNVSTANGNNILDGGTGSNFLVGGTGHDTFFVDDRGPTADIWSTIKNFHSGDDATVWGLTPTDFNIAKLDNQGAVGNTGLTFSITAPGKPNANLTIVGYTTADLTNGRLSTSFGHTQDLPGLPGSDYMLIHAT